MESLAAVLPELQRNWWCASLDLKDAFLHLAIHPSSRKCLSFAIGDEIFRFRGLPFGLSTVPCTFTRVVKVIAEHLRRQGVYVFIYLDDWLLTAPSPEILRHQVRMVANLVQRLGFTVNFQKSTLQPSQKVQFLGSQLDFTRGMVFPTEDRVQSVIQCASLPLQEVAPPARLWMRVLGLIASLKRMLPQSILRMQIIQLHELGRFRSHWDSLSRRISRTTQVSNALSWWTQPSNVRRGKRFVPLPPSSTLATDAPKAGLGAHWGNIQLFGTWSPFSGEEAHQPSRVIGHSPRPPQSSASLQGPDSTGEVRQHVSGHVHQQEGRSLQPIPVPPDNSSQWCQRYQITLQAEHLPGVDNNLADACTI